MKEGGRSIIHGFHMVDYTETEVNSSNNTSYSNTSCSHDWEEDESSNKWVRNLSSTPLTEAQTKVLAHGPNFTVVPRSPPVGEYRVAIENAYNQLKQGEAED